MTVEMIHEKCEAGIAVKAQTEARRERAEKTSVRLCDPRQANRPQTIAKGRSEGHRDIGFERPAD